MSTGLQTAISISKGLIINKSDLNDYLMIAVILATFTSMLVVAIKIY